MTRTQTFKLLVTGGGTGGHLFPAIAVAEAFCHDFPGSEVLFVGTSRKLDTATLARHDFAGATIRCQGLKGAGLLARLKTLLQLPLALVESAAIIRKFKPDLVFGVGGYVTGPVILAAGLLGIPTCIHEQNSIPGLANRMLGRIARRIFISLPASRDFFPKGKTVLTGNPVRAELLAKPDSRPADQKEKGPTLLVLGGSQGAHRVNLLVIEALKKYCRTLPADLKIIHQTGEQDAEMVQAAYAETDLQTTVTAFIEDMAAAYQQADLVVSRAGATTLAELMVLKKPALLIPYPYAADDHQEKNGQYLVENGAARMYIEAELTGDKLGRRIITLFNEPEILSSMAAKIGELARPDATEVIVKECLQLIAAGKKKSCCTT